MFKVSTFDILKDKYFILRSKFSFMSFWMQDCIDFLLFMTSKFMLNAFDDGRIRC